MKEFTHGTQLSIATSIDLCRKLQIAYSNKSLKCATSFKINKQKMSELDRCSRIVHNFISPLVSILSVGTYLSWSKYDVREMNLQLSDCCSCRSHVIPYVINNIGPSSMDGLELSIVSWYLKRHENVIDYSNKCSLHSTSRWGRCRIHTIIINYWTMSWKREKQEINLIQNV